VFTQGDRDGIRDWILNLATNDSRVVAAAVVGSLAHSPGDRWSDLDLTFGVAERVSPLEVLDDWKGRLAGQFDAVHLFDLPSGPSLYRVFWLPGNLQVDLSCTPAAQFGATSPRFRLLYGQTGERSPNPPPSADELFGYAVHHALRARFSIERARHWHAEYWISAARDYALSLACLRRGLPAVYGRGFDDLPREVRDGFQATLVGTLDRGELMRALAEVVEALLRESKDVPHLTPKVAAQLRELLKDPL
jgi:hypothetical protein